MVDQWSELRRQLLISLCVWSSLSADWASTSTQSSRILSPKPWKRKTKMLVVRRPFLCSCGVINCTFAARTPTVGTTVSNDIGSWPWRSPPLRVRAEILV